MVSMSWTKRLSENICLPLRYHGNEEIEFTPFLCAINFFKVQAQEDYLKVIICLNLSIRLMIMDM